MNIDISNITIMNNDQVVNLCHQATAFPALLILFITFLISFLLWGLIFVKKDRGKLMLILTLTFMTAGVMLLALLFLPNTFTQPIIDLFIKIK